MLPKLEHATFDVDFPVTGSKSFRPFLVSEEKVLLMAKSAMDDDPDEVPRRVMEVVQTCCLDKDFRVGDLATFELELAFLKLRSRSVSNVIRARYMDKEDEEAGHEEGYDFAIEAEKLKPTGEILTKPVNVKVNEKQGLTILHPTCSAYLTDEFKSGDVDKRQLALAESAIRQVWSGDEVFEFQKATRKERIEFIESLPVSAYNEVRAHIAKTPVVSHTLRYTNKAGSKRVIVLSTLQDFFFFA